MSSSRGSSRRYTYIHTHTRLARQPTRTRSTPSHLTFPFACEQISRSKRDILQEKYNACLDPNCSAQTRSVFIRVLKRIAESFMTCLLQMQSGGGMSQASARVYNLADDIHESRDLKLVEVHQYARMRGLLTDFRASLNYSRHEETGCPQLQPQV